MLSYLGWLSNWPSSYIFLSTPVLPLVLAFFALWPRRLRCKTTLYLITGYLVVANIAGLFVYQLVPSQYTRDQNWSWPPADERSLGLTHGKRLAIAADKGVSAPDSVYEEQADFFGRWLMGPTMAGSALIVFVMLAFSVFRVWRSKGGAGD